jgi:hypothetical protein
VTTPAQIRVALTAAVAIAGDVSRHAVVWGQAGNPIANPVVRLFATTDLDCIFDPRVVQTPNEDGLLDQSLSTLRELTVQIRVESTSAACAHDAYETASWISIGLSLDSVTAALDAVGINLIEVLPSNDLQFLSGDVMTYARTFDARFRYEMSRVDPTVVGVIEHVQISGEVNAPPTISTPVTQYDKPAA